MLMDHFYLYNGQLVTPHLSGFRYRGQAWWRIWKVIGHRSAPKEIRVKLRSLVPFGLQLLSHFFLVHQTDLPPPSSCWLTLVKLICIQIFQSLHCQKSSSAPSLFPFPSLQHLTSMKHLDVALPLRPTLLLTFTFVKHARILPVLREWHYPTKLSEMMRMFCICTTQYASY